MIQLTVMWAKNTNKTDATLRIHAAIGVFEYYLVNLKQPGTSSKKGKDYRSLDHTVFFMPFYFNAY